ncbi:hypothetical protein GCM10022393_30460 [Aquimarina addita]|uniref:Uncharacterized protein n=1 Tax=Aquimarina addita TaxID=870485 RepID=A0ABP6UNB7_9FLAO
MLKTLRRFIVILCIFSTIFTQISCNNDDDDDNVNLDCESAICTEILIRIMVSIKDQNQNPVMLDTYKVINLENGEDITISLTSSELSGLQEFGQYPLIEDGILGVNQELDVQFVGYVDDQEVVRSNYTVSTDCCHVSLDAGNLELVF